jgi:dolichyl-phosphate-mannose-protein mannosyltransferase
MASEKAVQEFVHKLEEGGWAKWVWFALLWTCAAFVYYRFMFTETGFAGLSHAKAMEQAQIAREIARGNGFSTKMIRPIAMKQFIESKGAFPVRNIPDTYHAPLNPLVNSLVLRLTKSWWTMTTKDIVYTCDRAIARLSMIFFLAAVTVNYFTGKRLFDRRLSLLGTGLVLLSDQFWQFSMSGLPQMLMLLIFSVCAYALVRVVEARHQNRTPFVWLAVTGLLFGLLALTHSLTIAIFFGALVFCAILCWPRGGGHWAMGFLKNPAYVMLAVFLVIYTPWLVRNYKVCGSPVGVAIYADYYQLRGTESQIMRAQNTSFSGINPLTFRNKMQGQTILQFNNLYAFLGSILVAPIFFVALLHPFKKPEAASYRWGLLLMWVCALGGMAAVGMDDEGLHANDLHVLFAPLLTFYGFAFVLVLWGRWEIHVRLVEYAFLVAIYLVSALPFITTMISPPGGRVHWPPYVPPWIAVLNDWVSENEVITSDMPWAVAWYADRKCLWLPMTVQEFVNIHDQNTLNSRLVGLYLTPVSGNKPFLSEIVKGEYSDWQQFITRTVNLERMPLFPLRAAVPLPIENQCVFYADRDRWSTRGL